MWHLVMEIGKERQRIWKSRKARRLQPKTGMQTTRNIKVERDTVQKAQAQTLDLNFSFTE